MKPYKSRAREVAPAVLAKLGLDLSGPHPPFVHERDWRAMRMHVSDGMTYADIGAELGVGLERARSLVTRALGKLEKREEKEDG